MQSNYICINSYKYIDFYYFTAYNINKLNNIGGIILEGIYCTIIGDIVDSKKIEPQIRGIIQRNIIQTMDKINFDYDKYICSRFRVTLGDEFQGALYSTYPLFEILEKIKYSVHPYKIRFGIGVDSFKTKIRYNDSLASDGNAYYYSREAIEILKKKKTFDYGYLIKSSCFDLSIFNTCLELCDTLSEKWTKGQKEYIEQIQLNENIEISEIANKNEVSVSTVSRQITKSGYKTISNAIKDLTDKLYNYVSIGEKQSEFLKSYNKTCVLIDNSKAVEAYDLFYNQKYGDSFYEYISLMSIIYFLNKDYQKTIECGNQTIKALNREFNLEKGNVNYNRDSRCKQVKILNLLGVCYTDLKCFNQAKAKYEKALNILEYEEWVDSWRIYTIGNLARLYSAMNEFSKAEKLFIDIKRLIETNNIVDKKAEISVCSSIGKLYYRKGLMFEINQNEISQEYFRTSVSWYEQAYEICENYLNKNAVAFGRIKLNLSKALYEQQDKDINHIIRLVNDAINIFKRNKKQKAVKDYIVDCYELLRKICTENNEIIKANEYEHEIIKIRGINDV